MNSAIQVQNLCKSYGAHQVLKEVSFDVYPGEIFALLGVNGAGKTTTLECMEGLRRYDSGSISVRGKMGIQLQLASLPAQIKVIEAVRLFAKWNHVKMDFSMLEALGVRELAKKQYAELSIGQKRRLHLALALISRPDIVFLDEPTAGLDVEGRIALHSQIRQLKAEGKTIVLASHDMAEVESLCDRIAILNDGCIAFCGTVIELTERVGKQYTIRVQTQKGEEVLKARDIGKTLLALLEEYQRHNISVLDIQVDRGTLEQHFMEIARGKEL